MCLCLYLLPYAWFRNLLKVHLFDRDCGTLWVSVLKCCVQIILLTYCQYLVVALHQTLITVVLFINTSRQLLQLFHTRHTADVLHV